MDPNGSANEKRIPFQDITNVSSGFTKSTAIRAQNTSTEVQRKKEETNAKQREYRAKKKAESNQVISPFVFTSPSPTSHTEFLAREKKDEKNRKLCEWRARSKAESVLVRDVPSDNIRQDLTQTELLAKEKREKKNRQLREWRAKRKAESNSNQDCVPSGKIIEQSPSCQMQLNEKEDDKQSEISSIEKKREQKAKYMREWCTRKKAKPSNVDGGSAAPSTPAIGASSAIHEGSLHGTTCSTILGDADVSDKENLDLDDWLHRNDTYRHQFNAKKHQAFTKKETDQS
uniref:Uncharacterized protein n=1 Tax=Oryza punctata TaxID=4537 RepID=A0A0E0K6R8_ORYPU